MGICFSISGLFYFLQILTQKQPLDFMVDLFMFKRKSVLISIVII